MTSAWSEYDPYVPPHLGPHPQLSRSAAREVYEAWFAARQERWIQLQALVRPEGLLVGRTDADVRRLEQWFRSAIESNPEVPERLANRWYSVSNDLATVLGDIVVERCPAVRWEFMTRVGKADASYQKHALTGFTRVANPRYSIEMLELMTTCGH
jgi:hypothetical protein